MAITVSNVNNNFCSTLYQNWGITCIDKELFIARYQSGKYFIEIFDVNTGLKLREFTVNDLNCSGYGSLGTDGINLFVAVNSISLSKIVKIDKKDGSIIEQSVLPFDITLGNGGSFDVNYKHNVLIFSKYNTTANQLEIRDLTSGVLLKSYTISPSINGGGACVIEDRIVVSMYGDRGVYLSSSIENGFDDLKFNKIHTASNYLGGITCYKNRLYIGTYTNKVIELTLDGFVKIKHLLKSNNKTYSLNSNNELIELETSSLIEQDIFENYGIDDLSLLATPTTRAKYTMEEVDLEIEGKIFSKKIKPSQWDRKIFKINEVITE